MLASFFQSSFSRFTMEAARTHARHIQNCRAAQSLHHPFTFFRVFFWAAEGISRHSDVPFSCLACQRYSTCCSSRCKELVPATAAATALPSGRGCPSLFQQLGRAFRVALTKL